MIRKIFFSLFMLILTTHGFSQNRNLLDSTKSFIADAFKLYEINPTHLIKSNEINSLFLKKLTFFPENQLDTLQYSRLLLSCSLSEYEDRADINRNICRRCMIFSIYALSVDPDQSKLYLDLAEYSLMGKRERISEDLLRFYSGFLLLKMLIMKMNQNMYEYDYQEIKEKFTLFTKQFDQALYHKGIHLLKQLKE